MTLTPEQIAQGWRLHDRSVVCPIKDERTVHQVMFQSGLISGALVDASEWVWRVICAYRIIEAHGADAEPARPTPWPQSIDDLVYGADGWSQPFFTGGVWPKWLPAESDWTPFQEDGHTFAGAADYDGDLAIRVRRREPKRETVTCLLISSPDQPPRFASTIATIDLIDGKPDLSTLKIAEDAL